MTQYGLFLYFAAIAGGLLLVGLAGLMLFFAFALVTAWARQPERPAPVVERVPPSQTQTSTPFDVIIRQE